MNTSRLAAMILAIAALTAAAATAATPEVHPAASGAAALPGDSVYQLNAKLTDQEGRDFTLTQKRGQPVLVGMFYTSCEFVCPMLVEALRNTEAKLSAQERAKLSVLLITIDPARDTVAVLKRTAQQRTLDPAHWTLARSDAATTRKLAAVLGLQYRALSNGDFNHSTDLILLDADGRVAGRTAQLTGVDPTFLKQVKAAAQ
ncbi:SCO family protein [Herbaspirillum sp. NPDC087042]|uniref:SCO family protein n=1 Tax=Herbaspirillum sp. NPDC087042 TaxID=3364004 RepID=UPI00381AAA97